MKLCIATHSQVGLVGKSGMDLMSNSANTLVLLCIMVSLCHVLSALPCTCHLTGNYM